MNLEISLGEVEPHEHVGHDVARSSEAKARTYSTIRRSMRKNIRIGDGRELSVNRVSEAERRDAIADLVDIIRQRRTPVNQQFQGWGMLWVEEISREGFKVAADPAPAIGPMPQNPFHALIILPEAGLHDLSERDQNIKYLAELAAGNWKSRPEL